jgi:hypothetical protein
VGAGGRDSRLGSALTTCLTRFFGGGGGESESESEISMTSAEGRLRGFGVSTRGFGVSMAAIRRVNLFAG